MPSYYYIDQASRRVGLLQGLGDGVRGRGGTACCTRSSLSPAQIVQTGALAMRAILWVPKFLVCASMATAYSSDLRYDTRRSVASVITYGSQHRPQLQRTAENGYPKVYARAGLERRPAGAEDGRPLSSSAHARTTQDPVRVCHGSDLPAALSPHCSNTHQSLQLSPSAMLSSPTVQLAECCENVGSGRARTY